MISKPDNSFAVVIICDRCVDTGTIFAVKRDDVYSGPYAFRCECAAGKNKNSRLSPVPENSNWVPEYLDKRPTDEWFDEKFRSGKNLLADSEFQNRQNIWGRWWFRFKYEQWKSARTPGVVTDATVS